MPSQVAQLCNLPPSTPSMNDLPFGMRLVKTRIRLANVDLPSGPNGPTNADHLARFAGELIPQRTPFFQSPDS